MQIAHFDAQIVVIIGELLCHAFGQRGHQHALTDGAALGDFAHQIVDLGSNRADFQDGVEQTGGAHHLFHHLGGVFFFVSRRRGGHKHGLRHQGFKFFEFERAVVAGGGQAEAIIHQVLFARGIAFVHGTHLRHGHVRFVHEQQRVFGEVIKQSRRRGACGAAREVA